MVGLVVDLTASSVHTAVPRPVALPILFVPVDFFFSLITLASICEKVPVVQAEARCFSSRQSGPEQHRVRVGAVMGEGLAAELVACESVWSSCIPSVKFLLRRPTYLRLPPSLVSRKRLSRNSHAIL